MPQLDTVTYMSQFFWLCIFFIGFYFSLVQFFLPKMARILRFRQEKMSKIQEQSSYYLSDTETQQMKRWSSVLACLEIQRNLAQIDPERAKELVEETWENEVAFKSQQHLETAFEYDNEQFNDHMISQNASISFLLLTRQNSPLFSKNLTNCYFLEGTLK